MAGVLARETKYQDVTVEPIPMKGQVFDQESILPMALIREYCKADDVLRYPDALLSLYRDASLEAAEAYTGMILREQRVITQDVADKRDLTAGHRWKEFYKVRLKAPTVDGVIYLYGGKGNQSVVTIMANPGDEVVRVPYQSHYIDMTPCCGDPCGKQPSNHGMKIMYRAGLASCDRVPAVIRMGCLKYIAWVVSNPGDTVGQRQGSDTANPQTSGNNTSWQSGAIEEWRLAVPDAY